MVHPDASYSISRLVQVNELQLNLPEFRSSVPVNLDLRHLKNAATSFKVVTPSVETSEDHADFQVQCARVILSILVSAVKNAFRAC